MDDIHPEAHYLSVTSAFSLGAVLVGVEIDHFFEYVLLLFLTIGVLTPYFGGHKSEE
jgi:hypothetical protein